MQPDPVFAPEKSWQPLQERIEVETDPRCRKLLEQVCDHMQREIGGELDALMDTLVDDPRYHMWGFPVEAGPKGRETVREFYRAMIKSGGHRFHFDIKRIMVDHHAVITEGRIHQKMGGADLIAAGMKEIEGEAVDPDGFYLSSNQIITVWPAAEDGRLVGEDIYMGGPFLSDVKKI
ncbi:MAG: nuclear transport factor 2 family protein [Myxococcota bacterium]|nr:nuclear transport factor 2 family protein [Myxococcota bacterium]